MAIEKCIDEFDVDEVIFEEGSSGRELYVVLDGKVEITSGLENGQRVAANGAELLTEGASQP